MTEQSILSVAELIAQIRALPEDVAFADVMATISAHYDYQPVRFTNGVEGDSVVSEAGTNEGSCKIFAFGQLNGLTESEVLACFGDYYRKDVLQHPEGSDHGNIRTFIKYGWKGIELEGEALIVKSGA